MPIANLPQGTNRGYFGDACECDSNTCPVNTVSSSRFFNLACSGEVEFTSNKHLQPITYILVSRPGNEATLRTTVLHVENNVCF